ncbi:metallophosphoesterase [Pyxidicoccus sp. 3LG]
MATSSLSGEHMAAVHYVFLSDLHFGERNSLLSDPTHDGATRPLLANDALDGLVACLRDVARANPPGVKPQLVLVGDIFELALAPTHVALDGFDQFIDRIFPAGEEALFSPDIVFIPGNHDHELWTSTRDELIAERMMRMSPDDPLEASPPTTRIFAELHPVPGAAPEQQPTENGLLTRMLCRRHPTHPDLRVVVGYPNLGLIRQQRMLLAHHGHFADDVYLLMTPLARAIYGEEEGAPTIAQLETDNAAWIDFLWSSLGREGRVGAGVRRSYDMLKTDSGKVLLASRLAGAVVSLKRRKVGRRLRQRLLLPFLLRALDLIEENDVRQSLESRKQVDEGVINYLMGPLAAEVARELGTGHHPFPTEHIFIYGHTHHPLAQELALPEFGARVRVYNTGGWVVDTPEARPSMGGALLLVDDALDTVLVQLCAQTTEPHLAPVMVLRAGDEAAAGPLMAHVRALVDRTEGPWRAAASACGNAILRRRAELSAKLLQEMKDLPLAERLALGSEYLYKTFLKRERRVRHQLKLHLLTREQRERREQPRTLPAASAPGTLPDVPSTH